MSYYEIKSIGDPVAKAPALHGAALKADYLFALQKLANTPGDWLEWSYGRLSIKVRRRTDLVHWMGLLVVDGMVQQRNMKEFDDVARCRKHIVNVARAWAIRNLD